MFVRTELLQAEFFQFALQCRRRHSEQGGGAFVAINPSTGPRKNFRDIAALHFLETGEGSFRRCRFGAVSAAGAFSCIQISRANGSAAAQNSRTLDHIAQFADIAGPFPVQQVFQCFRTETEAFPAAPFP